MDRGLASRGLAMLAVAFAAALVFAVPAGAAGCGGLLQPQCPPRVYPIAPDPGGNADANLSVPPAPGKFFGFNTNLWWRNDSMPAYEVDRTRRAGAEIVRTTVTWAAFASSPEQPLGKDGAQYPQRGTVPNSTGLARLDALYDLAVSRGERLDLIIDNAPKWASAYAYCTYRFGSYPPGCGPVAQHKRLYPTAAHLQDLANFVTALGQRYPGVIFETWNEPNLDRGPQAVGGAFIGQMQCAVWHAAKALAEPALVLSAAFGDFRGEDATRAYMRDFYSTGDACFDRLSVHTYNGASSSFGDGSPLAGHMKIYRDARAEAGDTRPMWITEFGFTTDSNSDWYVSERDQAALTWQEYNKLLTMPDVEAALVHTLRDQPSRLFNPPPDNGYGWVRGDGSLKPVYCEFSARAGTPAC